MVSNNSNRTTCLMTTNKTKNAGVNPGYRRTAAATSKRIQKISNKKFNQLMKK